MKNVAAIETLARHRKQQFFMTVRMKKTRIFKNILKSKNYSPEKYFRFFWVEIFKIFENLKFSGKSKTQFSLKIRIFEFFSKKFKIFDPRNFRKYFSDEEFFDLEIFSNFRGFLFEPSSKIVSPYAWAMFQSSPHSR